MVRLVLIALFMMIVVCVGVYALWTIQVSQLKQDNLATDFKKTDSSLHRSNDSLEKNVAGIGAFKRDSFHLPEVELAIKANAIIGSVDSMKHELALLANQKGAISFSYTDDRRLLVLKNRLADYNAFIKEHFRGKPNIKPGDSVSVSDVPRSGIITSWEDYYFKNTSLFAVITELIFIKSQVQKLQQKASN
ncbi:MAG: hypothetical protein IPP96_10460 [Chitinophagaceae bacterium]|nr:hypothetical protein [Chitinophagaceae bacterium]